MSKKSSTIIFIIVAIVIILVITFIASKSGSQSSQTNTPPGTTSAQQETTNPQATSTTLLQPMNYTLAQVAQHKTKSDCWTTVNGGVYNLTPFINQHPGGVENIMKVCGINGTSLFMAQHGGQADPMGELTSLMIGVLAQ